MSNRGGRWRLKNQSGERRWLRTVKAALAHPIISSIVVLVLVAAGSAGWRALTEPSPVASAEAALGTLNVGINSDAYDKVLGTPVIRRRLDSPKGVWIERLWINDLYAVQTVSDSEGTVGLYSVTSRDPSLSPKVKILETPLRTLKFQGKTAGIEVSSWGGLIADFWYSEADYMGAGVYKTVVMTASPAGSEPSIAPVDIPQINGSDCVNQGPMCPVTDEIERQVRGVRDRLQVTTYTLLNSDILPLEQLPRRFRFGPSLEDISAASGK